MSNSERGNVDLGALQDTAKKSTGGGRLVLHPTEGRSMPAYELAREYDLRRALGHSGVGFWSAPIPDDRQERADILDAYYNRPLVTRVEISGQPRLAPPPEATPESEMPVAETPRVPVQ